MVFLQIAWSNLLRSRRRTIVTLLAMMLGIAVMVFTNGFNAGMSEQWADNMINERTGHLQIHHRDYYKYSFSDPKLVLIPEPETLIAAIRQNSHVVAVMPQVVLGGLIGTEDTSAAFGGAVNDLASLDATLPAHVKIVVAGQPLSKDDPNGVLIGKTLAKELGVGIGDDLILLANTVAGDQGSTLVTVRGLLHIKDNPNAERNAMIGGLSAEMRTDLLDIGQGATNLVVRLDDKRAVPEVIAWLNQQFATQGAAWVAEPWDNETTFTFLTGIFRMIGIIVMIILSLIASFIISNALLMSIFERIREVGTMRAVGMENGQVYRFFYWEYLLFSTLGGLGGLAVGVLLILIGRTTGVSISDGIFTGVRPVLELSNLLSSFFLPLLVAAIVAAFPVRSSCRMSVVESLNYN